MSADLHCHSKYSDGSTDVEELVLLAKKSGINAIAVTDHDTFLGSERAAVFGEKYGVKIIKGTEISCYDYSRKRKVHLLCYLPKKTDKISDMIQTTLKRRSAAINISIQKIIKEYPITYDMILKRAAGSTCIYKQHIMQALMDAGYTDKIFGDLFRKFFDSRSGIAKSSFEYPDVFDALKMVKESGGAAVLAHPAVYDSYDVMLEMIERGLDGIEVHYPRARESDEKYLTELCDKYGLIKTGGTDFHGMNTTKVNPIGTCTATDEELEKLISLVNSRD